MKGANWGGLAVIKSLRNRVFALLFYLFIALL